MYVAVLEQVLEVETNHTHKIARINSWLKSSFQKQARRAKTVTLPVRTQMQSAWLLPRSQPASRCKTIEQQAKRNTSSSTHLSIPPNLPSNRDSALQPNFPACPSATTYVKVLIPLIDWSIGATWMYDSKLLPVPLLLFWSDQWSIELLRGLICKCPLVPRTKL